MVTDQDYSNGTMTTTSQNTIPTQWGGWQPDNSTTVYWPTYPYCTHGGISDYSIEDLARELSRKIQAKDNEGEALEKLLNDIKAKRVTLKT